MVDSPLQSSWKVTIGGWVAGFRTSHPLRHEHDPVDRDSQTIRRDAPSPQRSDSPCHGSDRSSKPLARSPVPQPLPPHAVWWCAEGEIRRLLGHRAGSPQHVVSGGFRPPPLKMEEALRNGVGALPSGLVALRPKKRLHVPEGMPEASEADGNRVGGHLFIPRHHRHRLCPIGIRSVRLQLRRLSESTRAKWEAHAGHH